MMLQQQLAEAQTALEGLQAELRHAHQRIDALQNAENDLNYFRVLLDNSTDPGVMLTDNGNIQYVNDAMCVATGLDNAELLGLRIVEILPGVSIGEILQQLQHRDDCEPMESGILHPTDPSLAVEIHIRRIHFEQSSAILLTAQDTTERRSIQRDLRLFRSAIEVSLNGIAIALATDDLPLTMVNKSFLRLTGYSEEEVIGKNCRFLQGPETNENDIKAIRKAIRKRKPIRLVIRNYRKDGTAFWNDLSLNPIRSPRGDVTHFVALQVDVTASIEQRNAAAQTAATMHALLNSTADGIYGLDDQGLCTFCNESALEMMGYSSEAEVLGKNMHTLLHHHHADGREYPMEECAIHKALLQSRAVHVDDEVFWRKDGRAVPVEYTSDPIVEDGQVIGCVVAFRDISGVLHTQAELELGKEKAEIANNAKAEFIANMSHEIRTPLTAIMAYADLLTHGLEDPGNVRHSRAIKRNADHLLSIINDILDMSKIDAQQLTVENNAVDIAGLMSDLESLMSVRATEKGLDFSLTYETDVPQIFYADGKRVRQILLNLLSNAIKFTDMGGVTVAAGWASGEVYFSVADTGIGIGDDDIERLFEPFEQASEQVTRKYGGTGLGLSISRRLAQQMDGRVEVSAQLHRGSCFTLYLPAEGLSLQALTHRSAVGGSHGEPEGEDRDAQLQNLAAMDIGARVLLVDDLEDVRDSMQAILEASGCTVFTAEDGQRAVDAITLGKNSVSQEYDVVLMDMNMPVKDGFEAVRELRGLGYQGRIMAVTAGVLGSEREECMKAGCDDYLSKPFSAQTLLAKIELLLQDNEAAEMDAASSDATHVLIVDDYVDVARSVAEILNLQGVDCQTATSGELALQTVEKFVPHLCLLDVNMPGMNGIELMTKLQDHPNVSAAKFVAMTGETSEHRVQELLDAGFDYHLSKPLDVTQLLELVASAGPDSQ